MGHLSSAVNVHFNAHSTLFVFYLEGTLLETIATDAASVQSGHEAIPCSYVNMHIHFLQLRSLCLKPFTARFSLSLKRRSLTQKSGR